MTSQKHTSHGESRNKFYVYSLVDPRTKNSYYIGKGCGRRIERHFKPWNLSEETEKVDKIKEISRAGIAPEKHSHKISSFLSESQAYELESFIIEEIGIENLTNGRAGGMGGISNGKNASCVETNFSKREAAEIRWLSLNTRMLQRNIGQKYETTKKVVSKIKHDRRYAWAGSQKPKWYNGEVITEKRQKEEKVEKLSHIKWISQNTDMNLNVIGPEFGVTDGFVRMVQNEKRCKNINPKKPEWYEEWRKKVKKEKAEEYQEEHQKEAEAKWLSLYSNFTFKEIGKRYGLSRHMVGTIKRSNVYQSLNPVRPEWHDKPKIDKEKIENQKKKKVAEMKWLIQNTEKTHKEIANKYDNPKHNVDNLKMGYCYTDVEPQKPTDN